MFSKDSQENKEIKEQQKHNDFVQFFNLLYPINNGDENTKAILIDTVNVFYEPRSKVAEKRGIHKNIICRILVSIFKVFFFGVTLFAIDYSVVWKNLLSAWNYVLIFFK